MASVIVTAMSKKRKFVADGVFFAELNEILTRELAEVRNTPMRTEIIIRATRTQNVLGGRELTSLIQKRFRFPENAVELYAERVNNRGCALLRRRSLSGTNFSVALLSEGPVTVFCGSLWKVVLKAVR